MGLIELSASMHGAARVAEPAQHGPSALVVRIAPVPREIPGMPDGALWAWAVIEEWPSASDRILFGGTADSMTSAAGQSRAALDEELRRRAGRD